MMNRLHTLLSSSPLRLFFALLLAGCGNEGEEVSGAPLQDPPAGAETPAPSASQEGFDLSQMGHSEGNEETAILGIVEFSDFGCGHCANFHLESYGPLRDEFVESGEVLWKYIPITIGGFPNGNLAGAAGICALDLGSFPEMRDHLFEYRAEWLAASSATATGVFVRYATELGMDGAAFRACLESEEPHETIESHNRIAGQIGVNATPSFIVAGSMVRGAPPLDAFQTGLREILLDLREQREEAP